MPRVLTIENMPPTLSGRTAASPLPATDGDEHLALHALLSPNRSLTPGGFRHIMALIIGVNAINGLIYFNLGAWPVLFFCGLDIVIVWLAFTLSYAQGRRHERIMITDDALWVLRVMPSGHETRWKLSPVFTQVRIDRPVGHETQLRLEASGKTLIVGSFLSPKERDELAQAIEAALAKFRL